MNATDQDDEQTAKNAPNCEKNQARAAAGHLPADQAADLDTVKRLTNWKTTACEKGRTRRRSPEKRAFCSNCETSFIKYTHQ